MSICMQKLTRNLFDLINRFHHVHRNPNRTRLVSDCTCNCLTNPPRRIGGKFESLGVVKLFDCFNQTEISFLNQVEKLHAAAKVPLGNADN